MTKHQIKSIGIVSAFKIGFVTNAVLTGLLVGIVSAAQALLVSALSGLQGSVSSPNIIPTDLVGLSLGVVCLGWVVSVVIGAIVGAITFALGALIYNLTARIAGGLEVTLITYAPEPDPLAGQWDRARY